MLIIAIKNLQIQAGVVETIILFIKTTTLPIGHPLCVRDLDSHHHQSNLAKYTARRHEAALNHIAEPSTLMTFFDTK